MVNKNQYIKTYETFSKNDIKNESVIIRDDMYIVGGITIEQKTINAYCKKVKDQTGKDLKKIYSEQDIAEQLVNYLASKSLDVEKIPATALLGGEEDMNTEDVYSETAPETASIETETETEETPETSSIEETPETQPETHVETPETSSDDEDDDEDEDDDDDDEFEKIEDEKLPL